MNEESGSPDRLQPCLSMPEHRDDSYRLWQLAARVVRRGYGLQSLTVYGMTRAHGNIYGPSSLVGDTKTALSEVASVRVTEIASIRIGGPCSQLMNVTGLRP